MAAPPRAARGRLVPPLGTTTPSMPRGATAHAHPPAGGGGRGGPRGCRERPAGAATTGSSRCRGNRVPGKHPGCPRKPSGPRCPRGAAVTAARPQPRPTRPGRQASTPDWSKTRRRPRPLSPSAQTIGRPQRRPANRRRPRSVRRKPHMESRDWPPPPRAPPPPARHWPRVWRGAPPLAGRRLPPSRCGGGAVDKAEGEGRGCASGIGSGGGAGRAGPCLSPPPRPASP